MSFRFSFSASAPPFDIRAHPPIIHRVSRASQKLLILALAAIAFLPLVGQRDVTTSHEARVIQTARFMASHGWPWHSKPIPVTRVSLQSKPGEPLDVRPDFTLPPIQVNPWLVPTLNGEIRLQKPPLPYWCSALLFKLFNPSAGWAEWIARLTPALMGFFATFLVADLARRTIGRRAAFPAALVWTSLYFIPDEFRKSMADPYLAFFTLASVWAWIRAAGKGSGFKVQGSAEEAVKRSSGKRNTPASLNVESSMLNVERSMSDIRCSTLDVDDSSPLPRRSGLRTFFILHAPPSILAFYLFLALAMLSKGPPLFITLLPPLILFHIIFRKRNIRFPRPLLAHVVGLAIFFAITLPWPIYILNNVPHALEIWRFESLGEVTGENTNNVRPLYYYLPLLFQISLPWTPIWIAALILPFARRKGSGFRVQSSAEINSSPANDSSTNEPPLPLLYSGEGRGEGLRPAPSPSGVNNLASMTAQSPQGEGGDEGSALSNTEHLPPRTLRTQHSALSTLFHPSSFATLSYLLPILIFSLVKLKKSAYLLPATPFMALMIAQTLVIFSSTLRRFGPKSFPSFILAGQALIPLGFAIALPILIIKDKVPTTLPLPVIIALTLIPAALAIAALITLNKRPSHPAVLHSQLLTRNSQLFSSLILHPSSFLLSLSSTLIISLFSATYVTPNDNRRSPRPAAAALLAALQSDPTAVVVPDALPAETTLYLPLKLPALSAHPNASTLYHLSDDPKDLTKSTRTPDSFKETYPTLRILEVEPLPIPGAIRQRYKLYKLKLDTRPEKIYATTSTPGAMR